jgi:hypothetical protein
MEMEDGKKWRNVTEGEGDDFDVAPAVKMLL